MQVRNFQKELDHIIETLEKGALSGNEAPTLFLHSCCAPCSSYVLAYLRQYFRITVFYYNPNISEQEEYRKRVEEQKRLIAVYNGQVQQGAEGYPIAIEEGAYTPELFFEMARGQEQCPEGGERCFGCYALRLSETARKAAEDGFDWFATTLTISPLKNAAKLNEIGEALSALYGVRWLPSDFKKKDGYKQSVALSSQYGLYRQDYCGCVYSRKERDRKKTEQEM